MSRTYNGVPFRQIWLPQSKYPIKAPYKMVGKKLTLHETDNQMPAINEINYMNSNDNQTSYHLAVDDKEIIQAIPFDRNAWHSGDGGNGYGNRNTVAMEICQNFDRTRWTSALLEPLSTKYQKGVQNAIKGGAQVFIDIKREATNDNIATHNQWNGKWCPRKILNDGTLMIVKAGIINEYNKIKGIATAKPVKPSTTKKEDGYLTLNQVVDKAIAGGYGNYPARVANINNKTNYTYDEVQPKINARFNVTTPVKPKAKPTAEQVAQDIAAGNKNGKKWGNNPQRARMLRAEGYDANWIQRRIDDIILGTNKASSTSSKTAPVAIKVGDKVRVNQGAQRYAMNKNVAIPASVKGKVYTVQQKGTLNGKSRVLLQEITSWVWESDVALQASGQQARPQVNARTLYLPESATSWRIYKENGPYVAGSSGEIRTRLAPAKFGGLSYTIKGNPVPHVYLIDTKQLGRVAIYAHPSTGATIK